MGKRAKLEDLGNIVVDSLENQIKASEHTRDCQERRDKQELGSARDRAERAFFNAGPATVSRKSVIKHLLGFYEDFAFNEYANTLPIIA